MKINFIDLTAQQERIRNKIDANIKKVLDHGQYIMGPEVSELEEKLADFVGVKYCIAVSSGTDALLIAMMALDIGPGDEVITTAFSFIATAEMIMLLGAKPVFVDIDESTFNIDPAKIEEAITDKTKAIMPVSLYGQCADLDTINKIAYKHKLPVIEDGAQSFGATQNGKKSCGITTIGCTSFFPSKPLGGYGDSGACFTNDDLLAKAIQEIRVHGQDGRYHHIRIGINGRMDTIQAAILLTKLEIFPEEVKLRQAIGKRYTSLFINILDIKPPYIADNNTSVYAQYTIKADNRSVIKQRLMSTDIPTAIHYPLPLDQQPVINLNNTNNHVAKFVSERVLSIPMHAYMIEEQQEYIVDMIMEKKVQE